MNTPEVNTKDDALAVKRFDAIGEIHERIRLQIWRFGTNKRNLEMALSMLVEWVKRCGHLFPEDEFPAARGPRPYTLQPLAYNQQINGDYFYLSSHASGRVLMPHDHQCYALTAGLSGCEENILYRRGEEEEPIVVEIERATVEFGTGLACEPDDIHNIRVVGTEPARTFRFYGRSLPDQNAKRTFFDLATNAAVRLSKDDKFEPIG